MGILTREDILHLPGIVGSRYNGLRMTAEEYLQLPVDGQRYELVDGVVIMTPSPLPEHQEIAALVTHLLISQLASAPGARVIPDVDVRLRENLVYRPDIVAFRPGVLPRGRRIDFAPNLVVEIISPSSVASDWVTKRRDYEAAGVAEYLLIDPQQRRIVLFRLRGGAFDAIDVDGLTPLESLPGVVIDPTPITRLF